MSSINYLDLQSHLDAKMATTTFLLYFFLLNLFNVIILRWPSIKQGENLIITSPNYVTLIALNANNKPLEENSVSPESNLIDECKKLKREVLYSAYIYLVFFKCRSKNHLLTFEL